jgi:uncharacterized protein YqgC (DUF456 family)
MIALGSASALLGEIIENWISFRFAKRYGGSVGRDGALIGGLVGAFIGVQFAIVGSVIGAFLGSPSARRCSSTAIPGTPALQPGRVGAVVSRAAAAAVKSQSGW